MKNVRRSAAVTILHWVLAGTFFVSFFSGQRIAIDNRNAMLVAGDAESSGQFLNVIAPSGAVFDWHRISGAMLSLCLLTYLLNTFLSGHWRHLLPTGQQTFPDRLNKAMIWFGLGLLSAQVFLGMALGSESATSSTLHLWHNRMAWGLLAYTCVHPLIALVSLRWQRWLLIFVGHLRGMGIACICLVVAALPLYWLAAHFSHPLAVYPIQEAPVIDGQPDDSVWRQATALTIETRHGNNDRAIPVSIRALRDNERLYLLLEWPDTTNTHTHLPLEKFADGWKIVAAGFDRDDERRYYEDKFAVMLSNQSALDAMRSIHLGPQPLAGEPASRHRRGYHYTTDGRRLDIWHWKSVRSDHLFQADDDFFGPPLPATACAVRYKAGYFADPSLGGGSSGNFVFFGATVTPLQIPRDVPGFSQRSWMRWEDGIPYSMADRQQLENGTLVPGIVDHGPITGDRGDIGARASWAEGYWHLEMSRALDTGSAFDVPIVDHTRLWMAVFDNAQTRHSYHLRPVELRWRSNNE